MQPFNDVTGDAVALAKPGEVYVIYLPHGATTTINLGVETAAFTARWYDPRLGKFEKPFKLQSPTDTAFKAPNSNDWILLITRLNDEKENQRRRN
jgi:hypothetical protein